MAKRGRPKFNRPDIDRVTPELVAKRAFLTGGANPAYAEHPLGILYVRGYLSDDHEQSRRMYVAGMEFGFLWGRVFKPPFAQSLMAQFVPSGEGAGWDEATTADAEARLKRVASFLKERAVYDALVNAVIYRRTNPRTLDKLRTALCRLIDYNKSVARRAAA
ncbi:MAG: hypothetical protein IT566_03355 [Rhodospirillaceae bacterium]|nr:hypothetical protein [Rhodospirillaceae bacterium]